MALLSLNILLIFFSVVKYVYPEMAPIRSSCRSKLCITRCCPEGMHMCAKPKIISGINETKARCIDNNNRSELSPTVYEADLVTKVKIDLLGLFDVNIHITSDVAFDGENFLLRNGTLVNNPGRHIIKPSQYCMGHVLLKRNKRKLYVKYYSAKVESEKLTT